MGEPFDSEDLKKVALAATQAFREREMPINRSFSTNWGAKISQDFADEIILQAHMVAPVWSDYVLVKNRPDIFGLGFYASDFYNEKFTLMADDSLIVVKDGLGRLLITVVPSYFEGKIYYQIGFYCFDVCAETLESYRNCKDLLTRFEVIAYEDSKIIDELKVWRTGEGIDGYIDNLNRKRPIFIFRKYSNLSKNQKTYLNFTKRMLSSFGVVILNDKLFRRYRDNLYDLKTGIIAISPGGECHPLNNDEFLGISPQLSQLLDGIEISSESAQPKMRRNFNKYAIGAFSSASSELLPSLAEINEKSVIYREVWEEMLECCAPVRANIPPDEFESPSEPIVDAVVASIRPPETDVDGYPVHSADIPQWVDTVLHEQIVLAPRALRALKKSRHPDPRRIAESLELLAGPKLRGYLGEHDTVSEVEAGLLKLHLSDGFSNAERLKGQTGADYMIEVGGHRLLLERHLRSNSSGFNDPKMLRIYYVFDKRLQKIVVGWLPSHLRTSQS